jgi:hypothetical protein
MAGKQQLDERGMHNSYMPGALLVSSSDGSQRRNSALPAGVIVYTRRGRPRSPRRSAISIQMTAAEQ